MKIFVVSLAVLSALLFVSGHSGSHQRQHCSFPKEFDRKSRSCVCQKDYSKNHCVGYEKFCEKRCCHCPFSKAPPFAHPITKRWSQSNCDFVCKKSKPAAGCDGGRWSKSQCMCVKEGTTTVSPTTTTTKKVTAKPITTTTTPRTTTTTPTTSTTTATPTTTTVAPTTTTTLGPCGLFVDYNPTTSPNEPAEKGFYAGMYDNFPNYVGQGWNTLCIKDEHHIPGRLVVNGTRPGAFTSCGPEVYNSRNASYLQNNPNLNWVKTSAAQMEAIPGIIHLSYNNGTQYDYHIGRVRLTINGKTFMVVSKVLQNIGMMYTHPTDRTSKMLKSGFEVLSCSLPTTTTTVAPGPASIAASAQTIEQLQGKIAVTNAKISLQFTAVGTEMQIRKTDQLTPPAALSFLGTASSIVAATGVNLGGGARRKRQTNVTIPTSCSEVLTQINSITSQLNIAAFTGSPALISILNTIHTAALQYPSLSTLAGLLQILINLLTANVQNYQDLVTQLTNMITFLQDYKVSLCPAESTTEGTTTTNGPSILPTLSITSTCSYGTQTYLNDTTIAGISAGYSFDGRLAYVGFTTINGVTFPGGLGTYTSLVPGLYYTFNNQVFVLDSSDVSFITQGSDCSCSFMNSNAVPTGGYIVTFNSGNNLFAIGKFQDTTTMNYSVDIVGYVDIYMKMHYLDLSTLSEKTIMTNFEVLVCQSGAPATTVAPTVTTPVSYVDSIDAKLLQIDAQLVQLNQMELGIISSNNAIILGLTQMLNGTVVDAATSAGLQLILMNLQNVMFTAAGTTNLTIVNQYCSDARNFITTISVKLALTETFLDSVRSLINMLQSVLSQGQNSFNINGSVGTAITSVVSKELIFSTVKQYFASFKSLLMAYDQTLANYNVFKEYTIAFCGIDYDEY